MTDGKRVILYIDDDQDYLDMLRAILEDAGYEMLEARTAEEGLRLYASAHPDLVLVDLMMEEVDSGTSLVKDLRALGDPVPIVMISSRTGAKHQGQVLGVSHGLASRLQATKVNLRSAGADSLVDDRG